MLIGHTKFTLWRCAFMHTWFIMRLFRDEPALCLPYNPPLNSWQMQMSSTTLNSEQSKACLES